jgi:hypothetical protein
VNLLTVAVAVSLLLDAATGSVPDAGDAGLSAAAGAPLAVTLARIDELHRRRDDRNAFAEEERLVQAALARAPNDFGVLWRAARADFWTADDPGLSREQRSTWGKEGWDVAERAIAANPNDVAGYYWAAVCMGNYVLGLGVMKALSSGLEGRFRDRMARATAIDDSYQAGGVETAWGRFFEKLPWPKRDRKQAEAHLQRALAINPAALRARVYLASVYLDTDRPAQAKRLLDEVAAAPVGRYDPPEERRAKALAVGLLPELVAKLK